MGSAYLSCFWGLSTCYIALGRFEIGIAMKPNIWQHGPSICGYLTGPSFSDRLIHAFHHGDGNQSPE